MVINSAKLIIEFLDPSTGELTTQEATLGDFKEKKASSTRTRKPKDDGETEPMIHVLEGKLQLNNKAVELTGYEPEMKIDIQFEKKGRQITPVMMVDEAKGNRLTKTFTISCRGQKRENLLQYGDTFTVEPHEKEGLFKLIGNVEQPEDDIIDVPEEISLDDDEIDVSNIDFNFD